MTPTAALLCTLDMTLWRPSAFVLTVRLRTLLAKRPICRLTFLQPRRY